MSNNLDYIWKPAIAGAFTPGRNGHTVRSIILHSSCGRKAGDILTLTGHDANHLVSSHWYVDKGGAIYHFVQNSDTAYHAGVVCDPKYANSSAIGIETEHMDQIDEPWPVVQVQAIARLCVALLQHFPGLEITHHATVACPPGRKTDPVNFPSDVFWHAYEEASTQQWEFNQVAG